MELSVTVGARIEKVTERYWWPSHTFKEARRKRYNCYVPGRLYVDVVVGFRYFFSVNGKEQEYKLVNGEFVKC